MQTMIGAGAGRSATPGLLPRALGGDREAFDEVARRYQPALRIFVERLVGDFHDAQDVVQETFLRALRSLPRVTSAESFRPWLFRIALNLSRDCVRDRRLAALRCSARAESWRIPGDHESHALESHLPALVRALRRLPEEHAVVLLLRSMERLPYRHIAARLGVSTTLVRVRLHRGRKRLEEHLRLARPGDRDC
jgi:RNA polymerase sigma-70 factor (ECF subfamily)